MATFHKSKSDLNDRRRRCCNRHPKHRQSPGVCSLCLTEKLSQIISAASTSSRKISDYSVSSSSSASSSYYSSANSSCSSPNRPYGYDLADHRRHRRFFSASSIFKKSRSISVAASGSGKIKSSDELGFWSRFLNRRRRNKRMELEARFN